jgi:hypothetical protein
MKSAQWKDAGIEGIIHSAGVLRAALIRGGGAAVIALMRGCEGTKCLVVTKAHDEGQVERCSFVTCP